MSAPSRVLPRPGHGRLPRAGPAAVAHDGPNRWTCLAHDESSHRWHINSGNGHDGGLQFSLPTWKYYGGPQWSENYWPHRATRREQIRIGKRVAWRAGVRPSAGDGVRVTGHWVPQMAAGNPA